jgi:hypothetical protein
MDVKTCDGCKKPNLDELLLLVMEWRGPSLGATSLKLRPTDPLIGFRVAMSNAHVPLGPRSSILLCKSCAEKKMVELVADIFLGIDAQHSQTA